MSTFDLNAISNSLNEASKKTEGAGVSFAGKGLKLNTEDDGKSKLYSLLLMFNYQISSVAFWL